MRDWYHQAWLKRLLLGATALLVVTLIGLTLFWVLIRPRGRAFDFFAIWFGVRRIWRGQNPYGLDIARAIQRHLLGKVPLSQEHQPGFAYPLYIALMLGPFALLPFPLAVTAWCTLLFLGLMAFPVLAARTFHWNPSMGDLFVFSFAVLLGFRYPTIAFILGQTTIFVLLCVLLGVYWLDRQCDILSGTVLALTLIKPTMSVLLVAAVFGWGILYRRWKVLIGLVGSLAVLLGFSLVWQPMWVGWFIAGTRLYVSYAHAVWPVQQAGTAWIGGAVLMAIAGLTATAIVKAVRTGNRRETLLAFCFLVILSLAALPQTGSYDLTLLLIPAAGFLGLAPQDRWARAGVFVSLASPWLYWWLQMQWGIRVDQLAQPFQFALIGARILSRGSKGVDSLESFESGLLRGEAIRTEKS